MRNVELLMPAGNLEKLEYAVRYGADAVYLGVVDFSLRAMRKGEIITLENLKRAIDLAHKLGAKAYLTLNIFAFNEDIKHLEESMDIIKENISTLIIANTALNCIFYILQRKIRKLLYIYGAMLKKICRISYSIIFTS